MYFTCIPRTHPTSSLIAAMAYRPHMVEVTYDGISPAMATIADPLG